MTSSSSSAAVIITGGGGFLGQCLATRILERGHLSYNDSSDVPISKLILADVSFPHALPPPLKAANVAKKQGDITDPNYCSQLFAETEQVENVSVFHLAGVMSGDGERDFDLCLRVNLTGFLNMMEGARRRKNVKFVFTSSGFTVGSGAPTDYISKDDVISDATRSTPHTTYGATKACCELLLTDYARRGFVDARGVRLPTIVVRAGAPNAAVTGCFSAVIREPLSGVDAAQLPIAKDVKHAVTGTRAAIAAMLTLHDVPLKRIEDTLGFDRTVFLPAVPLSLGELEEALLKVVKPESQDKLGKISCCPDEHLSALVESFPTKIDAARAMDLGIPPAPRAETLVREYVADFSEAVADGIDILPPDV